MPFTSRSITVSDCDGFSRSFLNAFITPPGFLITFLIVMAKMDIGGRYLLENSCNLHLNVAITMKIPINKETFFFIGGNHCLYAKPGVFIVRAKASGSGCFGKARISAFFVAGLGPNGCFVRLLLRYQKPPQQGMGLCLQG